MGCHTLWAEELRHLWLEVFSSSCPGGEEYAWTLQLSQPKALGIQVF